MLMKLTTNFLQKLKKSEISVLMAIFNSNIIQEPKDLVFLRNDVFLLTLKNIYGSFEKDKFNRYKTVVKSIIEKYE